MNANQKAICDKVAKVNRLIKNSDGLASPQSFEIRYCEESVKVSMQAALNGLVCVGIMIVNVLLFLSAFRKYILILSVIGGVSAVLSLISALNMKKQVIARVDADNITIKCRTYNCGEIDRISKFSFNNLRLMSGGRCILALNKSCDGCEDLIRWAQRYNIPINDDSSGNADNLRNKQAILTAFIVLISLAAVFIILFLKRK